MPDFMQGKTSGCRLPREAEVLRRIGGEGSSGSNSAVGGWPQQVRSTSETYRKSGRAIPSDAGQYQKWQERQKYIRT
jgi:hypothetical protein